MWSVAPPTVRSRSTPNRSRVRDPLRSPPPTIPLIGLDWLVVYESCIENGYLATLKCCWPFVFINAHLPSVSVLPLAYTTPQSSSFPHSLSVLLSVSARLGVAVESGCITRSAAGRPPSQLHRPVERRHRHQAVEEELCWKHPLLFLWPLRSLKYGM